MSTNGNKGRFSERLSKMRRDRIRIRKYGRMEELEEELIKKKQKKAVLVKSVIIPVAIVTGAFTSSDKKHEVEKKVEIINDNEMTLTPASQRAIRKGSTNIRKQVLVDGENAEVLDLDISFVLEDKDKDKNVTSVNKVGVDAELTNNSYHDEKSFQNDDNTDSSIIERQKLEKAILDLFKKRFIKNINELELLQSDLYILSQIDNNDIEYQKCLENIKTVRIILNKIRDLKENYDFLKDNYDFEYLLELNDNSLIDKIIELREMCSKDQLDDVIEEYKLLDEYQYLYTKIDELEKETVKFEDYKDKKVEELKERDIKFEDFKNNVVNLDKINNSYVRFVDEQNEFLKDLEEKIANIDSYEQVELHLKGFDRLLNNTFKYMALLLVSPLKGLLPSVATEMLITRNTIKNLRNNLKWEETRKMVYTAIDYDSSIRYAIANVEDVSGLVDNALDDVVRLKREFNDRFSQYSSELPEYKAVIKKLNKMENAIAGNRVKLNVTMDKLKHDKMVNENKLKRVKKLNDNQVEQHVDF